MSDKFNHDVSIGLLGRDPVIQFVRLAADYRETQVNLAAAKDEITRLMNEHEDHDFACGKEHDRVVAELAALKSAQECPQKKCARFMVSCYEARKAGA